MNKNTLYTMNIPPSKKASSMTNINFDVSNASSKEDYTCIPQVLTIL